MDLLFMQLHFPVYGKFCLMLPHVPPLQSQLVLHEKTRSQGDLAIPGRITHAEVPWNSMQISWQIAMRQTSKNVSFTSVLYMVFE